MIRHRSKLEIKNNPIHLIEQGEVLPLPYETMQCFWEAFVRGLIERYPRYVDFFCMLYDMTYCYKPEAKEYAQKVEKFMKAAFVFWSFVRRGCPIVKRELGNVLKLAFALGYAYGFKVEEDDVKNAVEKVNYEKFEKELEEV